MQVFRVIVIGGYGFFGRRLVQRLALQAGLHIVVCGRSAPAAQALVDRIQPTAQAALTSAVLDIHSTTFDRDLTALAPTVTVHASGPFQAQDYRVAQACIACGSHYIDLADGRTFVQHIGQLDDAARHAGVAVVSGASSVPALSSAATDHLATHFSHLDRIDIGISPGNRTDRGLSTVQAILSYCGQPLPDQGRGLSHGWSGRHRHTYPAPVGARWLSPCDVPDLVLLPTRYPGTPQVDFGAGLELPLLHVGMNAMAALTRWGLVADWSAHAAWLKWAADRFKGLGSDAGAMHVTVSGTPRGAGLAQRSWHLLATHGDGPYVPTLAAAALIRKLRDGEVTWRGARPCVGMLSLNDFAQASEGLHITLSGNSE